MTAREPLVSADVDLRGYEFMPLYGDRLKKSQTWITADPAGKVAALELWWHAYAHEVPAGSLPDDDRLLADYAGFGVSVRAWLKVRPQAMRGWVMCSDGRLYHPFVAELVLEAWKGRQAHYLRTLKARIAALEKRLKSAESDAEKHHIEGLLNGLRQSLSQIPVTDPASRSHRTGQERTGQDKGNTPPSGGAGRQPDLDQGQDIDPIFGPMVQFLIRKGVKESRSRRFIGLMRQGFGDELVAQVIREAERDDITDPVPWIHAALKARFRKQPNRQHDLEARNQRAVDEWLNSETNNAT